MIRPIQRYDNMCGFQRTLVIKTILINQHIVHTSMLKIAGDQSKTVESMAGVFLFT